MSREKESPRQAVLLGNPGTKRTVYLEWAAKELGLQLHLLSWDQLRGEEGDGGFPPEWERKEILMKIDPPLWDSCDLGEQNHLAKTYRRQLKALSLKGQMLSLQSTLEKPIFAMECRKLAFLNQPEEIGALLDKDGCKRRLMESGLLVTEFFLPGAWRDGKIQDAEALLTAMEERHVYQVFIKPVYGSGAAGVGAFRFQPRTGRMALYTCAQESPSGAGLVNTKQLRCFREPERVWSILNRLLATECVFERWYAKAEHQGWTYDLRAVVQEGRLDFLLARLSEGPVTNLQLNNSPLDVRELRLSSSLLEEVEELCQKAAGLYPGLNSVGIDVLLEKESLKPRIIEMNGQGDLIYQDIYHQNQIYRHQARMMKEWLEERP